MVRGFGVFSFFLFRLKNETHTRTWFCVSRVWVQPVGVKMNSNLHPSSLKPTSDPKLKPELPSLHGDGVTYSGFVLVPVPPLCCASMAAVILFYSCRICARRSSREVADSMAPVYVVSNQLSLTIVIFFKELRIHYFVDVVE
jgi:hypothetical protein